jgi:Zn-dependent peptidase ImmA (M78 family)
MRRALEKAQDTYKKHGTTNPATIARALGLRVFEEDLKGRLREVYFGHSIVVRQDMSPAEKREMLAHALGHHLMHAGNHLSMQNRVYSFGNHHERQADVFAACLLVPEDGLEDQLATKAHPWEIAEHFKVTEKLVSFRMKIRAAMVPAHGSNHELRRLP